jgi:hypothetical protein
MVAKFLNSPLSYPFPAVASFRILLVSNDLLTDIDKILEKALELSEDARNTD